ncbi:MAG TPA: DNA-directed RNA polymerase subunit alpha C-terminal domain-containing protein [Burkholderiaceae bacterium]|nr:DNA-directed RNA polymerase subunit alpha C-terminal domain-containing protein [Burkholderiaceae bacterium]
MSESLLIVRSNDGRIAMRARDGTGREEWLTVSSLEPVLDVVREMLGELEPEAPEPAAWHDDELLGASIHTLELPTRTTLDLLAAGIGRVGDLARRKPNEVFLVPGIGRGALRNIERALEQRGLSLGMVL